MASLYYRKDAIYLSYRKADGSWDNRRLDYHKSNPGEHRAAQRLCDAQTLRERIAQPSNKSTGWEWVEPWIEMGWAHAPTTRDCYAKHWRSIARWIKDNDLTGPATISRELCLDYPTWRAGRGGQRNTSIHELKFLGQVLDEALKRGMIQANPARKLGLHKMPEAEKEVWSHEALDRVDQELARRDRFGWMRVTFLLGRFQAARLRQCCVPLDCVDFASNRITYPDAIVKGRKGFTQPLDERIIAPLKEIVEHRRANGKTTLCDFSESEFPSLDWRKFLDELGLPNLVHHGLRSTWATEAARRGISESMAMKFTNHASATVHRIYQKFSTGDLSEMLRKMAL